MKLFQCSACRNTAWFENTACVRCARALGYDPAGDAMLALEAEAPDGGGAGGGACDAGGVMIWRSVGGASDGARWRYCDNHRFGACNWLVAADAADHYCRACRHNRTVPDVSDPENAMLWRRMEGAKRRLIYSLLRLRLPLATRVESEQGLCFEFLAEGPGAAAPVMTGHANGRITIALVEAHDAEREKRRTDLGEAYRTLLGHFRHEVGHYYWDRLIANGPPGALDACRAMFGDEREDYAEALRRHYAGGPRDDWQENYVSFYAAAHPWEDFAETWAHYLHIVDTLETGWSWGVSLAPGVAESELLSARIDQDPYAADIPIKTLIADWHALSAALNSFNRAMGFNDLYPFVLTAPCVAKLSFIHDLARGRIPLAARAGAAA